MWALYFYDEEDNYAQAIEAEGVYTLSIPAGSFAWFTADEVDSEPLPGIEATYFIGTTTGIASTFNADSYNVYTINGVKVISNGDANSLNTLDAGIYVINGKKVIIRK